MVYRTSKHVKRDLKTGRIQSMWTPALKKKAVKLYATDGLSLSKTAATLDCSVMALYNLLKSLGLTKKIRLDQQPAFQWLDKNKKMVLSYYERHSAQQLAVKTELPLRTVVKWLKHREVFRRLSSERVAVARASGIHITTQRRTRSIKRLLALDENKLHPLEYRQAAKRLTSYMFQDWGSILDPKGCRSYTTHLDHIFSVHYALHTIEGSVREVRCPLYLLAHPANLRMLARSVNSSRHNSKDTLSYDITALKKRVRKFEKKHGDPYAVYKIKD